MSAWNEADTRRILINLATGTGKSAIVFLIDMRSQTKQSRTLNKRVDHRAMQAHQ
jgi:type I site-specific restriction endonuclease